MFPFYATGLFWLSIGTGMQEPGTLGPFSAKAKDLKEQYYLRDITPAKEHDQIWLEAYPRSSRLAANYQRLRLIFSATDMSPIAMRLVQPNGRDSITYRFNDAVVNAPPTPGSESFRPAIPIGWQKIVEEPPIR
jgi:hypothetical protein